MKKISVCACITYSYEIEVPDELCEFDDEGYLKNEAALVNRCSENDPSQFSGVSGEVVGDIISIYDEDDYCLYNS